MIQNCDSILQSLTDEQLQKEVSPGKNRGIYLLGHLIAVHDDMVPLLSFGDRQYPALAETFIKSPDKSVSEIPSARELRKYWSTQKEFLAQKFNGLTADEWFEKHSSVSAEDFSKEPHRNKLNILLTRTTHLSWHTAQLALLK